MVAAILASVRRTICLAMMLRDLLASRAMNAVRVQLANQRIKACRIVWILALKLHQRIQAFGCAGADGSVSINFAHVPNDTKSAYCRQGDTYLCVTDAGRRSVRRDYSLQQLSLRMTENRKGSGILRFADSTLNDTKKRGQLRKGRRNPESRAK